MPEPATHICPHGAEVNALAEQTLPCDRLIATQRHLEHCQPCRRVFRRLTADRFPRLRSYTVIERIGAGAFAEVFKAIHHAKERTEALKVLYTETRFRTASFENEVHLIARLRHPNIAALYDAHLGAPPYYYTMELVDGRRFDEFLHSDDVSLARQIEMFRRIALAIDYAHRQGVVHRDLKPQNILIDTADQPRIVDFGIARKLTLAEEDGVRIANAQHSADGTYGYIAPEEKAGRASDGRADIYALGVMLNQAVTGTPPDSDEKPGDPLEFLRRNKIHRAGDLAAIITRCLQEQPAGRYATCAKLAEDLSHYLAGRPVAAHGRLSTAYRAWRAAGLILRNHALAVSAAVVVIVAIGLGGLFHKAHARQFIPGLGRGMTAIIEFVPSTIAAMRSGQIGAELVGLSADNVKSWRLLHGELMKRLARAGPSTVVWDYFVPDCHPPYDQALIRGLDALRQAEIPVVIGVRSFDLNGKPTGCRPILAAAHSYGALHVADPKSSSRDYLVPICIRRGLASPIPSLSVAGYAAARFPDSQVDLRIEGERVIAAYRRRQFETGRPEWQTATDSFAVQAEHDPVSGLLHPGDDIYYARFKKAGDMRSGERTMLFEQALTASPADLKAQFGGRVVLIGAALPGRDEYTNSDGTKVFGYQVQARALDELLARARITPISREGLMLRTFAWSAPAAALVQIIPVLGGVSFRRQAGLSLVICTCSLIVGTICIVQVSSFWFVEAAIGACTLLVTGSLIYLAKAARQSELLPQTNSPPRPQG